MPIQTPSLGLKKPQPNETADIAVINENMDTIDTVVAGHTSAIAAHAALTNNPHAVTAAQVGAAPFTRRVARVSNIALVAADSGRLIDITSGTFTQTFAAVATLGNGWSCYIRNSGTGDITLDPSGAETIDGQNSFVMYPGETRLILCDGAALFSVVLNSFSRTFLTSGTFVRPPGYVMFWVEAVGGGGGSSLTGPSGGGGGGYVARELAATALTSSVSVVVGAGGVMGAGGGSSVFGSNLVVAPGGRSGEGVAGGDGGGAFPTWAIPSSMAGIPSSSLAAFQGGLGGRTTSFIHGGASGYGGGGGGYGDGATRGLGGGSVYGGGGGGGSGQAGGGSTLLAGGGAPAGHHGAPGTNHGGGGDGGNGADGGGGGGGSGGGRGGHGRVVVRGVV